MKMISFPELRQTFEYDCGASALQSVLAYYGIDVREELVMNQVGTKKKGSSIKRIEKVAVKYGLKTKLGKMTIEEIKKFINKQIPVIVLLQAWSGNENIDYKNDWKNGHFVVVIGYDNNKLYFEDPYSVLRTNLKYADFLKRWHDKSLDGKENLINFGLAIYGKNGTYDLRKSIRMK